MGAHNIGGESSYSIYLLFRIQGVIDKQKKNVPEKENRPHSQKRTVPILLSYPEPESHFCVVKFCCSIQSGLRAPEPGF